MKLLRIKYELSYIPNPIYLKFKCEYKNISRNVKIVCNFVSLIEWVRKRYIFENVYYKTKWIDNRYYELFIIKKDIPWRAISFKYTLKEIPRHKNQLK